MDRSHYPVAGIGEIPSPSLLYFRRQIEGNIDRMVEIAGGPESAPRRLRPHIKTFKTMGVVELLRSRGITKFKCATLAETEMLAQAGVTDILLAYPVVGPNIGRLVALASAFPDAELKVLGDNARMIGALSRAASEAGVRLAVLVDIDPGLHRTGVVPEEAPALGRLIASAPGLAFGGLHFYDGQNHQRDYQERLEAAHEAHGSVMDVSARLEKEGFEVPRIVMGGTPTFPCYAQLGDTELSPGTCAVHDWGYASDMPDLPFVPAGLVLGRVVSLPTAPDPSRRRFTIDVGAKAISTDRPGQRGLILGYENAVPVMQNEEHWVWELPGGGFPAADSIETRALDIGAELLIAPAHICPTTALYDEVVVVGPDGAIEGSWEITARRRRLTIPSR